MTWRIGLLIPSSNAVIEVDFYRNLPRDATLHTNRTYTTQVVVENEERAFDQFTIPAAEALGTVRPHVVVFGCLSAGLLRGSAYDRDLCDLLGKVTGAVAVSIYAAAQQALRETCASRVAVVTPYTGAINQRIRDSIEADGIEVSALHGMGIAERDIASVTANTIYSFIQSRIGPRVPGEALLLWGTEYPAMDTLSLLRMTYAVPIVTSNLAALQAVKRVVDSLRERATTDTSEVATA